MGELSFLLLASLVFINFYAFILVILRGVIYKTRIYRPMLKNIFLSILTVFALFVAILESTKDGGISFFSIFCIAVWFLLLPNSGYLITELNLNHRKSEEKEHVPLWYDIISTLTLATSGIVNTLFNIFCVQVIVIIAQQNKINSEKTNDEFLTISLLPTATSWLVATIVIFVLTFGIYLGRYIRFNSWDILNPWNFLKKIVKHFQEKGKIINASAFCFFHTIFLGALYAITATPFFMLMEQISKTNH